MAHHFFGVAAEQEMLQPAHSMRAHDNEIAIFFLHEANDFAISAAFADMRLALYMFRVQLDDGPLHFFMGAALHFRIKPD